MLAWISYRYDSSATYGLPVVPSGKIRSSCDRQPHQQPKSAREYESTGMGNHFSNICYQLPECIFSSFEWSLEVFLTFELILEAHRGALGPLNWEKLQTLLLARQKDIIKKVIIRESYENNFKGSFHPPPPHFVILRAALMNFFGCTHNSSDFLAISLAPLSYGWAAVLQ